MKVPIPKWLRFEVLKRDKFKCQYCGATVTDGAPLHVDHIVPECDGGETSMINLVTACMTCNIGKGTKHLDDDTLVQKQAAEIDRLAQQQEVMDLYLQWRTELVKFRWQLVDSFQEHFGKATGFGIVPEVALHWFIDGFGLDELLAALDICVRQYTVAGKSVAKEEAEKMVMMLPRIAANRRRPDADVKANAAYIVGILRSRLDYLPKCSYRIVDEIMHSGVDFSRAKLIAREVYSWHAFCAAFGVEPK